MLVTDLYFLIYYVISEYTRLLLVPTLSWVDLYLRFFYTRFWRGWEMFNLLTNTFIPS